MFPQPQSYYANNGATDWLKSIFGRGQNPLSTPQSWGQTQPTIAAPTIPGYSFNPYQIQTGDTFSSIAQKNNMTEAQLRDANNGMLVPPPKGSYVNLPTNQFGYAVGQAMYGSNIPSQVFGVRPMSRLGAQYGPGYRAQPSLNPPPAPLSPYYQNYSVPTTNMGSNWFSSQTAQRNDDRQLANMQAQINSGVAPTSVPSSQLAYLGATPQSMQNAGYVFNQATGTWNLKGAGAGVGTPGAGRYSTPQSNNNWQTNDKLYQYTWGKHAKNYKNRFETNLKWAKNAFKRKHRDRPGAPVGPRFATQAPQDTLALHLGSG